MCVCGWGGGGGGGGGRVQIYPMGIIKGFLWVQNDDFAMR